MKYIIIILTIILYGCGSSHHLKKIPEGVNVYYVFKELEEHLYKVITIKCPDCTPAVIIDPKCSWSSYKVKHVADKYRANTYDFIIGRPNELIKSEFIKKSNSYLYLKGHLYPIYIAVYDILLGLDVYTESSQLHGTIRYIDHMPTDIVVVDMSRKKILKKF